MQIIEGEVLAGDRIGNIKLNITKDELLDIIGTDYRERTIGIGSIIAIENANFWIATDGKVDQIGVGKGFQGMYKNSIGIGSTLADVKKQIGNYTEVGDTYELQDEKGICFELEDVDDWDELTAPIEFIYVFRA